MYVCVCLTLPPGHRCWRGIPAWGSLINVKVTSRGEGWRLDGEGRAGERVQSGRRQREWRGGTHVSSCASPCLCLGGMRSHMKEALFLSASLWDSSLVSVSKAPLSPSWHTTCQQINPQLQKHTQPQMHVKTHTQNTLTYTQAYTHTYRCALHTQFMSIKFPSNRKSELRRKQTHKIPSSLDCLITMISTVNSNFVTNNHRVGPLTCHPGVWWFIAWHSAVKRWSLINENCISLGDCDVDWDTDRELSM